MQAWTVMRQEKPIVADLDAQGLSLLSIEDITPCGWYP